MLARASFRSWPILLIPLLLAACAQPAVPVATTISPPIPTLTPSTTSTPVPTASTTTIPTLKEPATLAPTITVTPIPTTTPSPTLLPTPVPNGVFALLLYTPLVMNYDPETWKDESNYADTKIIRNDLISKDLKTCQILVQGPTDFNQSPPVVPVQLGNIRYQVITFVDSPPGYIVAFYIEDQTLSGYHYDLGLPVPVIKANKSDWNECKKRAEKVLATLHAPASPYLQFQQVKMFSKNAGWAVGADGNIFRTTEGIQTWRNVTPPYPETNFGNAAYFLDIDTAFLVIGQMVPIVNGSKPQIIPLRTMDGGATWQAGKTLSFPPEGPAFGVVQLYFIDKNHGWLLSMEFMGTYQYGAILLETRDGGLHYKIIYRTFPGDQSEPGGLWGPGTFPFGEKILTLITDLTGFTTNAYEQLVTSKDGGKTWQALELQQPDDYPHLSIPVSEVLPPLFSSDRDGVVIVRVYERSQLEFPPCCTFYELPKAQYLYYTHDAGQTWLPQLAPAKIGTLSFLNSRVGWFLGKDDPSPSSGAQLQMTHDGGETWSPISSDTYLPLGTEIQFIDEQIGFAYNPYTAYYTNSYHEIDSSSGVESYLYTTKDGGRTWVQVEPKPAP